MSVLAQGARLLGAVLPGLELPGKRGTLSRNVDLTMRPVPVDVLVCDQVCTRLGSRLTVFRALGGEGFLPGSTVTIGQFDGVHLGHQALLAEAVSRAEAIQSPVGAITFDRHPMSLLAPDREPRVLTNLEEKVGLLFAAGLDFVAVLRTGPELLATDPTRFVDDVLVGTFAVRAVVVGPNFRFGRRAAGDPRLLANLGITRGFAVHCPSLSTFGDTVVSSTRIRKAIDSGDLGGASAMLGRPLAIAGRVVGRIGAYMSIVLPHGAARPRVGHFAGQLRWQADGMAFLPVWVTIVGALAFLRLPRGTPASAVSFDDVIVDLVSVGTTHRAAVAPLRVSPPLRLRETGARND